MTEPESREEEMATAPAEEHSVIPPSRRSDEGSEELIIAATSEESEVTHSFHEDFLPNIPPANLSAAPPALPIHSSWNEDANNTEDINHAASQDTAAAEHINIDDIILADGDAAVEAPTKNPVEVRRSFHDMYRLHAAEFNTDQSEEDEHEEGSTHVLVEGLSPRVLVAAFSGDEKDNLDESLDVKALKAPIKKEVMSEPRPSTAATEPPTLFFQEGDQEDYPQDNRGGAAMAAKNFHTRTILRIQKLVLSGLFFITGIAVRFPRITLAGLSLLSVGLLAAGLFTNFQVETDTHDLWPPQSSLSIEHAWWLWKESWFNLEPVIMDIIIHKDGTTGGVLGQVGVERVFEVQETFTSIGEYKQGCAWAELFGDYYWVGQCHIDSVTDFWNESYAIFESTVDSDQDVVDALSQTVYPNGVLVEVDKILGNTERDEEGVLTSAESYLIRFSIPWSNNTLPFEGIALDRMLLLQEQWKARGDEFQMEVRSYSSYSNEFMRSIQNDLWLLPLAFVIVTIFTVTFAFGKWDKVKSRGLLGIGATVTIVASIMASFGILFCVGIPFTAQTLMVPFLMFGIGLDDAFIIYGSYNRKAHLTDIKERVHSTMEDVGVSIFLTSLTSMLAFILGSFSDIPAVSWLCLYAFPCIGIDFLYQITFFVALVVLDERRIQQGRIDYCPCIIVRSPEDQDNEENEDAAGNPDSVQETVHAADRLMAWWARQLLKGPVQQLGFMAFVAILGASIFCATKLHQEFDFVALVPHDSYLKSYYSALDTYTTRDGVYGNAVFRFVDQSDPQVQAEMFQYIGDLVRRGNVDEPVYFWLKDFQIFSAQQSNNTFHEMSFDDQINQFLSVDIYHELYNEDFGMKRNGHVTETRVEIHINVDIQNSKAATDMLSNMREISASQPINQDLEEWKFFTYTGEYHLYEFYNRVIQELIFTSVMSVVAVTVIALFFIPHWSAVLFVFPFISFLYVNMLGYLYLSGVQINAISYVTLVMSIGLMIDYIMHILMRYYDCQGTRQERVQETMSSIGASIFLGAASTFLGVMCLSMSTSDILQDIFVAVVGLITFGVLNGLIFLPIALVWFGPEGKQSLTSEPKPQGSSEPSPFSLPSTPERMDGTFPISPPHSPFSDTEYTV